MDRIALLMIHQMEQGEIEWDEEEYNRLIAIVRKEEEK